jgi:adenosylcobyric acid synthase
VCGTYLHGVFESPQGLEGLVESLCRQKGISPEEIRLIDPVAYKEEQYDLLAQGVRQALDMKEIYRIMEEGIE